MEDLDFDKAVQRLHQHPQDPDSASKAINYLGEASHVSATDRERLADQSILKDLLTLLDAAIDPHKTPAETSDQILRCIGNAVISSDEARQMVTDHGFTWASACLRSAGRVTLNNRAFNALHNICFNYPPAQKRCYEDHVYEDLLYAYCETYSGPVQPDLEQAERYGDLLLSICEHRQAGDDFRDEASRERVLDVVLSLRDKRYDTDAIATAVEFALLYLRDDVEKGRFIAEGLVGKVWKILVEVEEQTAREQDEAEEESVKLLVPLSISLTWCLSDIAAHEKFAAQYGKRSELMDDDVLDIVKSAAAREAASSAPKLRILSAACQILGNLLWSTKDQASSASSIDVMEGGLHNGLMRSVVKLKDAETLYSIVGLLIQLCRYSSYRTTLCNDEQLHAVLTGLCEHDSKEIRQSGMKLLQLLGKDNAAVREEYADLAKQFMESLVAEQTGGQDGALQQQQNGSVVELPD